MTPAKGTSGPKPVFESRAADWLGTDEALERILAAVPHLPLEGVSLEDALGRALAEDLHAEVALPPWDNSAMDGYAVRGADLAGAAPDSPVALRVTGTTHAGATISDDLSRGTAVRIMTGAPVPPGADSVVRVEDTDREAEPGTVHIFSDRDVSRNVRPGGEDMRAGDLVLAAGTSITPRAIASIASIGRQEVPVRRRPLVAVLPTGDELRAPGDFDDVRAGLGIPESNSPMLVAAARGAGCRARSLGIASDDVADLKARIDVARDADVLVTIGGASMGEADLVKRVLDELGFELDFWRVRIRPGSPFSFGWLPRGDRRQAVFGLPGNPTSAYVTFELFVRPFLLALAGHRTVGRRRVVCRAGSPMRGKGELTYYLRVGLDDSTVPPTARLAGPQGSGLVTPLASADGLAIVPESVEEVAEGDPVTVLLLDEGPTDHPCPAEP